MIRAAFTPTFYSQRPNLAGQAYELAIPHPRTVFSDPSKTIKEANLDKALLVVSLR
jgi:hypothetical protein